MDEILINFNSSDNKITNVLFYTMNDSNGIIKKVKMNTKYNVTLHFNTSNIENLLKRYLDASFATHIRVNPKTFVQYHGNPNAADLGHLAYGSINVGTDRYDFLEIKVDIGIDIGTGTFNHNNIKIVFGKANNTDLRMIVHIQFVHDSTKDDIEVAIMAINGYVNDLRNNNGGIKDAMGVARNIDALNYQRYQGHQFSNSSKPYCSLVRTYLQKTP